MSSVPGYPESFVNPVIRRFLEMRSRILLSIGAVLVLAALVWQGWSSRGVPDPTGSGVRGTAATLDTAILVFREGLEAILVLAAITASFVGGHHRYRRPVALGAALGFAATLITWCIAVAILTAINAPALAVQAWTGILAIALLWLWVVCLSRQNWQG